MAQSQQTPQKAIIEWIFRRTGTADWHGEKVAVLCASKTQLRAYNSPEILKQVGEIVERFTNATEDVIKVHVRFFVSSDTRWRHTVFSQLTPVGNGPQGQQIWTMRMADAQLAISQMQIQQGFRKLADERVDMVNGQILTIRTSEPRTFAGGMQREAAAGQGYTPRADKLDESIILKLSPLLTFEGDSVDASHRPDRQHGPHVPPHQGDRPPRERPAGDVDRRPRGLPDPPRPDRQELAAGPDPAHHRRHPPRDPRQEGGLAGHADRCALQHRGPRLPRRRDGRPRPAQGDGARASRDRDDDADAKDDPAIDPAGDPPPRAKKGRRATRGPDLDSEPGN